MTKHDTDPFPLKIAKGEQFCNRIEERKLLSRNIALARPTVLISPGRRYGKSSLVYKVAEEVKMPFEAIDLFLAHDDKAVTKRILSGIAQLVSQIMPVSKKTLALVQNCFSSFKIAMSTAGFGIEVTHESGATHSVDQIFDALKALAKLAEERKQRVILFIDEFQDIVSAESSKAIQGAIRHVAQSTPWIIFIFSGSSKSLLLELFNDKNKPLYKLCDKMIIERIASTDYISYIQKAAKKRWKNELQTEVIVRTLTLTQLHPFYINMLCNELWKNETPPNIESVSKAWLACYEQEERWIVAELEKLTNNQQELLKLFALHPISEPTSQHFVAMSGLPLSSVRQGFRSLIDKDMLHQIKQEDIHLPSLKVGEYQVLDPLIGFALRKYS